ncbi:MAG TPA: tetraacyldisaccharide 4'-kinase, partial [Planctomycetaceae bacterium]|nr:tetraacyldisaccharide 4'-kinase [Planctomycetaceae bacterium]
AAVERRVRAIRPDALWLEVTHEPRALTAADGSTRPLDVLRDRPVAAFCGLGNPAGFRHTIAACGFRLVELREFPDHHRYDRDDVESLSAWADRLEVDAVVCTVKDLVKLDVAHLGRRPLWAVSIELSFLAGREPFEQRLRTVLRNE